MSRWIGLTVCLAGTTVPLARVPAGAEGLRVEREGRYFMVNGQPTFLLGNREGFVGGDWNREYWNQDEPALDYAEYVGKLKAEHLNFVRLTGFTMAAGAGRVHAANERPDAPDHPPNPPYTRRPWLRTGPGKAWDGLAKYDLAQFDPWYLGRLREFVLQANAAGIVVEFGLFHQHNLYQIPTHYADNPFRPENNINGVELPEGVATAYPDFYESGKPRLRAYQEAYVRKVIDTIGDLGVLLMVCDEYNWEPGWIAAWAGFIKAYASERGWEPLVGVGAALGVVEGLREDPNIDYFDVTHFGVLPDGTVHSVPVGEHRRLSDAMTPEDEQPANIAHTIAHVAALVDVPLVRDLPNTRESFWTALASGAAGGYYHGIWQYRDGYDPVTCAGIEAFVPEIRHFGEMRPAASSVSATGECYAIVDGWGEKIAYVPAGGDVELQLGGKPRKYTARWFDPRAATWGPEERGEAGTLKLRAPDNQDWVLYVAAQ